MTVQLPKLWGVECLPPRGPPTVLMDVLSRVPANILFGAFCSESSPVHGRDVLEEMQ
jgi:hypothetical protein